MGERGTATVQRPERTMEESAAPTRQLPLMPGIAPGWLNGAAGAALNPRRPGRPDPLAVEIGVAIATRRQECGLSQAELASVLDCDRSAVSRWEMGLRLPTVPHLMAIGRALGCGGRALLPE